MSLEQLLRLKSISADQTASLQHVLYSLTWFLKKLIYLSYLIITLILVWCQLIHASLHLRAYAPYSPSSTLSVTITALKTSSSLKQSVIPKLIPRPEWLKDNQFRLEEKKALTKNDSSRWEIGKEILTAVRQTKLPRWPWYLCPVFLGNQPNKNVRSNQIFMIHWTRFWNILDRSLLAKFKFPSLTLFFTFGPSPQESLFLLISLYQWIHACTSSHLSNVNLFHFSELIIWRPVYLNQL